MPKYGPWLRSGVKISGLTLQWEGLNGWFCVCDHGVLACYPSEDLREFCSQKAKLAAKKKRTTKGHLNLVLTEEPKISCYCERAETIAPRWRFGSLTVQAKINQTTWACTCDCGGVREALGAKLASGDIRSCRACASSKAKAKKLMLISYEASKAKR